MTLYLTTLGCFNCGDETTYAHEGSDVPVDQEAPWPEVKYCPACQEPYPNDLAVVMDEVAEAKRVAPEVPKKDYK